MEMIMKKTITMVAMSLAAALLFGATQLHAQQLDGVKSMRGSGVAADDKADALKLYGGANPGQQRALYRSITDQPPMISHALPGFDKITLTENQCMICHSVENYEKRATLKFGDSQINLVDIRKKASKVSDSHMTQVSVPGGGKKNVLDMARWQCDSCHVPQVDANPLVDTTFKGGRIAKQ